MQAHHWPTYLIFLFFFFCQLPLPPDDLDLPTAKEIIPHEPLEKFEIPHIPSKKVAVPVVPSFHLFVSLGTIIV